MSATPRPPDRPASHTPRLTRRASLKRLAAGGAAAATASTLRAVPAGADPPSCTAASTFESGRGFTTLTAPTTWLATMDAMYVGGSAPLAGTTATVDGIYAVSISVTFSNWSYDEPVEGLVMPVAGVPVPAARIAFEELGIGDGGDPKIHVTRTDPIQVLAGQSLGIQVMLYRGEVEVEQTSLSAHLLTRL